jgi:hypothetical protein
MSTGLVFPGSVPGRGFRSASHISPRLRMRVGFYGVELRIDTQAFGTHLARGLGETIRSQVPFSFTVHAFQGLPDVGRPR